MPDSSEIECMSPRFLCGGTFFGNYPRIHHGNYIASHIVGYDDHESHQVNGVTHPLEDFSLCIKYLGEKTGFKIFLIKSCALQYYCIGFCLGAHNLLFLDKVVVPN